LCSCRALRPRPDRRTGPKLVKRCCPRLDALRRLQPQTAFRGSITRPRHSLSTLRSPGLPSVNHARLASRLMANLCRVGPCPRGCQRKVSENVYICRVAPRDCSPGAPTDPDVRISRIRFLKPRFRYARSTEWTTRAGGNGCRRRSRFICTQLSMALRERRLSHLRHARAT